MAGTKLEDLRVIVRVGNNRLVYKDTRKIVPRGKIELYSGEPLSFEEGWDYHYSWKRKDWAFNPDTKRQIVPEGVNALIVNERRHAYRHLAAVYCTIRE